MTGQLKFSPELYYQYKYNIALSDIIQTATLPTLFH